MNVIFGVHSALTKAKVSALLASAMEIIEGRGGTADSLPLDLDGIPGTLTQVVASFNAVSVSWKEGSEKVLQDWFSQICEHGKRQSAVQTSEPYHASTHILAAFMFHPLPPLRKATVTFFGDFVQLAPTQSLRILPLFVSLSLKKSRKAPKADIYLFIFLLDSSSSLTRRQSVW